MILFLLFFITLYFFSIRKEKITSPLNLLLFIWFISQLLYFLELYQRPNVSEDTLIFINLGVLSFFIGYKLNKKNNFKNKTINKKI